ncbi:hypothetical protein [Aeromonas allosaccharophila]|uniref:hypothetical protein n=1 Tax=Aeromonas allosaccharophila TaxID=656 RepID=UPI0012E079DC|nr:hypothetical protein [Aeromonas allosaccharophila]
MAVWWPNCDIGNAPPNPGCQVSHGNQGGGNAKPAAGKNLSRINKLLAGWRELIQLVV